MKEKIALVCIAKNEDHYIDEWIDYHKKLGFDDIFIYENNWEYNGIHEDVKIFPVVGEVMQIPAYNHFMNNYHRDYDWAAFIDIDEFIVLKQHTNIHDFVKLYGATNSIAMNWVMFGDNGHEKVDGDYSVLKRFTKRQSTSDQHIKVITRVTPHIKFVYPHCTDNRWMDTNGKEGSGPFNPNGPIDVIQLNHYFTKTREEFQEKINRGRADSHHPIHQRTMSEFDKGNFNEVEDLNAYNFMFNDLETL